MKRISISHLSAPRRVQPLFRTLVGVACVVSLGACSSVNKNSVAAIVDGKEVSRSDFERYVNEFASIGQLEVADGVLAGNDLRSILTAVVKVTAYSNFLKSVDKPITQAQRSAVAEKITDETFPSLSKDLQSLIIDLNVSTEAINGLTPPADKEIANIYASSPHRTGVMCLSHIVTKEKSTAVEVLNKLNAGSDFEKLAGRYSIEPNAKKTGGALSGATADGEPTRCITLLDMQSNTDPLFIAGAVAAEAGVPYGPVQSSFGYHVILIQPFESVKDEVLGAVKAQPGALLATGYLVDANISVDPAYGRWVPATASIVAG